MCAPRMSCHAPLATMIGQFGSAMSTTSIGSGLLLIVRSNRLLVCTQARDTIRQDLPFFQRTAERWPSSK